MKKILSILIAGLMLASCTDWLDVRPKSEVDQKDLFQSEEGYIDALNGIYIELSSTAVYGDNLTMGFLDVLAQNYYIPTNSNYIDVVYFNLDTEFGDQKVTAIWNKMYNIIANCNNLIEHLERDDKAKFSDNTYQRLLGETVAMRAFLHFDLLRLYNKPLLSAPDALGIPYVNKYIKEPTQQSSTRQSIELVLADLEQAYNLLKDADEITSDNEIEGTYRENRMNYYAVAALLARVHLYNSNYAEALRYAQEVIDSERFTWIKPADILAKNDYTFYSEHIFSLYATDIDQTARTHFIDKADDELICSEHSINGFDGDDLRFKYWFKTVSTSSGDKKFLYKYIRPQDKELEERYKDPVLPIVKLGEMYLVASEALAHTDLPAAITLFNEMRSKRAALELDSNADMADFNEALMQEYEREFCGEGQLFYFYKRLNNASIIAADNSVIEMSDALYTLPFPKDEVQFGGREN